MPSSESFATRASTRSVRQTLGKTDSALPVRIGIVGCGALAEHGYLPALGESSVTSVEALIDRNHRRAANLADRWQVPHASSEIGEVAGEIDAAIVAAPNHLHAEISVDLLRRGIPVLVEKPMALSVAECDEMLQAARAAGTSISSGFVCRFSRAAQLTKAWMESGIPGRVLSFHAENGCVFAWPVVSGFLFEPKQAGGGVLMDLGPHLFDLLLWWLGPVAKVQHFDDNFGGVEAESFTRLEMENGARGTIRLSRTCRLRQTILLKCEKVDLSISLDRPSLQVRVKNSSYYLDGNILEEAPAPVSDEDFTSMLRAQIDHWAVALARGETAEPGGEAGRQTVALIERCYHNRQPWSLPWV